MKAAFCCKLLLLSSLCLLTLILAQCTDNTQRVSGDFATEQKELSADIDARIENFNNQLERLREKANETGEDIRAGFRVQLNELEGERQRLFVEKENVENATIEEWDSTRHQVIKSLQEIEKTIDQELERLEKEIQE